MKHTDDSEFVILWTSGVKKIQITKLFLIVSFMILIIYIFLSAVLTPIALNKSRQLLSKDQMNSFLPTIRSQQFSDSFKGFTYIVKKKINNEIENIFLHDTGNTLKNLSSNTSNVASTTVIAEKGIVEERKMILFNGQIISSKNENQDNEIIRFEQLNIDLGNLATTTIKKPKLQETNTLTLANCFINNSDKKEICKEDAKKEILPILIRRLILPFYIPVVALICSFLLIKNRRFYSDKVSIFIYSFLVLVFTELVIRYTGLYSSLKWTYIFAPFLMFFLLYLVLIFKFSKESKIS